MMNYEKKLLVFHVWEAMLKVTILGKKMPRVPFFFPYLPSKETCLPSQNWFTKSKLIDLEEGKGSTSNNSSFPFLSHIYGKRNIGKQVWKFQIKDIDQPKDENLVITVENTFFFFPAYCHWSDPCVMIADNSWEE